ncbi:MAG: hypothetical protein Q9164_006961, partial [Protoblastenia rupestris]
KIALTHDRKPSPLSTNLPKDPKQYASAVVISGRIRKPPSPEEIQTRQQFLHNLAVLDDVYLVNDLDNESPPLDFRFIEKSVLGPGVERATEDVMLGCGCLRSREPLKRGQFIDTYRGEIITSTAADTRSANLTHDQSNFLFDFDKFAGTILFDETRQYVCDGRHMGSPTRFINHSCDPNCRLFTVSYNHNDRNIYELAFFAKEAVSAGEELTFDYYDEEERTVITDEMADEIEEYKG